VDDLVPVLARFHREVVLPDLERVAAASEARLRDEVNAGFDAQFQRLDRLETEYQMLVASTRRLEDRFDRVEQQWERTALRSELSDLRARVDTLQGEVKALEDRLAE
jgi:hypothetical protein